MAGADVERIAFAQREYRNVTSEDLAVQARHPLAVELEYNTLVSTQADAKAFGDYVLDLRKQDRDTWVCAVNNQNYSLEIGDTISLAYPRFGLRYGGDFIVKGIKRDSASLLDELTLFGPRTYGDFSNGPREALDFTQATLPIGASVARPTTLGEFYGPAGQLVTAAANAPRIVYNPVTGTVRGMLVEPQRINLAKGSELASDTSLWSVNEVTTTADVAVAPDGSATADLVVPATTNAAFKELRQSSPSLTLGTPYTFSYYVKAAGYQFIQLGTSSGTMGTGYVNVDVVNGVVTAAVGGTTGQMTYGVENAGNGWFRVWYTGLPAAAGSSRLCLTVIPAGNTVRSASWAGDGTSGVLVWGMQLEAANAAYPGPSSYIQTTTAAVTRSGEVLYVNWGARNYPDGNFRARFTFADGTTSESSAGVVNGLASYPGLSTAPLTTVTAL